MSARQATKGGHMVTREQTYTFDEFWAYIQMPENQLARFELDEGLIFKMGASSKKNTVTAGRIIHFLNSHVLPRQLGVVTGPDAGFKIGSKKYRQPDVAFIAQARVPNLEGAYFTIAPDLAVEIVSEDEDVFKKAREYLLAGTQLVWAIYTDERKVYVFQLHADGSLRVQEYAENAVLTGGNVLPEWQVAVKDLFPS
jgi:Uma2 family endonuclease